MSDKMVSLEWVLSQLAGMSFPKQGEAYDYLQKCLKPVDPNVSLTRLKNLADLVREGVSDNADEKELAEIFLHLSNHLENGGALPDLWKEKEVEVAPRKPVVLNHDTGMLVDNNFETMSEAEDFAHKLNMGNSGKHGAFERRSFAYWSDRLPDWYKK